MGQSFLVDRRVLGRILQAAEVSPADLVVEVGPGRGTLTRALAGTAGHVVAVEMDDALAAALAAEWAGSPRVRIVHDDARETDLDSLVPPDRPYKLVANLPYYAATPIVRRFLEAVHKPTLMVVMLQREVAQSMAAKPGRMTVLAVATQLYGRPKIVATVPPRAFKPAPSVRSALLRIDVFDEPAFALDSEERFFTLVRAGFAAPRKQLHNVLRRSLSAPAETVQGMLSKAGIDPERRPGTLGLEEWVRLYECTPSALLG